VIYRRYWSDPLWKFLRIATFCTVAATLVILVVYLSGTKSWLDALSVAVIVNIVLNLALVIRTIMVRNAQRDRSDS
jgi:hypothetical protein